MIRFYQQITTFIVSIWSVEPISDTTLVRSVFPNQSRLLFADIAGYSPVTLVTDHNAIDRDQDSIEIELNKEISNAEAIYQEGGNSLSYARLKLNEKLPNDIEKKTKVQGFTSGNQMVEGTVYKKAVKGRKIVEIQYDVSQDQDEWVMCRVGALQEERETSGCFKANGEVTIDGVPYDYEYSRLKDNHNGRTLQSFSTLVESKMLNCSVGCPLNEAKMFADYYGQADYGDAWIKAAFDGTKTQFINGDADFSVLGVEARNEIIKKGTVFMNTFMYIIHKFKHATINCETNCDYPCNENLVHKLDSGVALYTGSLEGTDGKSPGKMLYQHADKRCVNFKTCGVNGDNTFSNNTSYVNLEILRLAETAQNLLLNGQCSETEPVMEEITQLMYVPLIQSALRFAYKMDRNDKNERQHAQGAAYAASILPRVHAADANAAVTIYTNMRVGTESTSFSAVKEAFESVYDHLGINCGLVGGIMSNAGEYHEGAEMCDSRPSKTSDATNDVSFNIPTSSPKSIPSDPSDPSESVAISVKGLMIVALTMLSTILNYIS